MTWLLDFPRKWYAFFFPVPGWKDRYLDAQAGQNVWPIPGRPDLPKLIPWPLEWLPTRPARPEDPEHVHARGFEFVEVRCVDSGQTAAPGAGLRCARCGIEQHPAAAWPSRGRPSFDAQFCWRCWKVIRWLT